MNYCRFATLKSSRGCACVDLNVQLSFTPRGAVLKEVHNVP